MPSFSELKKLYQQVQADEADYDEDLTQSLLDLIKAVCIELRLDPKLHLGLNLGRVDREGNFVRESTSSLPRLDRNLPFALQLVLDVKESVSPPNLLVTSWVIRVIRDGISLSQVPGSDKHYDDYEQAAKAVVNAFEAQIQSYSPYRLP